MDMTFVKFFHRSLTVLIVFACISRHRARQRIAANDRPTPSEPTRVEVALNAQTVWLLGKWTTGSVSVALVLYTTIVSVRSGTLLPVVAGGIIVLLIWLVVAFLLRPKT